jgi:hypothetical protein
MRLFFITTYYKQHKIINTYKIKPQNDEHL